MDTGPVNVDGTPNLNGYAPSVPSNAQVLWDPDAAPLAEVRSGRGQNSEIVESAADPALTLGHELIHAFNQVRGDWGDLNEGDSKFKEGTSEYMETGMKRELRAVGLGGYNKVGDITENDLRKQLGQPLRATYTPRIRWITCGGLGSPC